MCLETLLPSPAPEILDYLARHPEAQDTIDGILQWWILDACIRNWSPRITETVEKLVAEGLLEEKRTAHGPQLYQLAPRHRAALTPQPRSEPQR